MKNPRKLIRDKLQWLIPTEELSHETDIDSLNECYARKSIEETLEIMESNCKDVSEFGDLMCLIECWAEKNGISRLELAEEIDNKKNRKGGFSDVVLVNMNPHNKSNALYLNDLTEVNKLFS